MKLGDSSRSAWVPDSTPDPAVSQRSTGLYRSCLPGLYWRMAWCSAWPTVVCSAFSYCLYSGPAMTISEKKQGCNTLTFRTLLVNQPLNVVNILTNIRCFQSDFVAICLKSGLLYNIFTHIKEKKNAGKVMFGNLKCFSIDSIKQKS